MGIRRTFKKFCVSHIQIEMKTVMLSLNRPGSSERVIKHGHGDTGNKGESPYKQVNRGIKFSLNSVKAKLTLKMEILLRREGNFLEGETIITGDPV